MGDKKSILVVGGGMSGLTAAIEAAEVGYEVVIVEKNAYLGGRVAQLYQYFPKLCPPSCGLEINFKRTKNNPRVTHLHPGRSGTDCRPGGQLPGNHQDQAALCQ